MPKTLLNGVNEVLKKADLLDSDVGVLSSLTDSARQAWIDTAVQGWNEVVDELYSISKTPKPNQLSSDTITLVANDRDYHPNGNVVRFRTEYHLLDKTNNHQIIFDSSEDAWRSLTYIDPEVDDTGLPGFCVLSPEDGQIVMDKLPTATEAGRVYTYWFDQELELVNAGDTFPFGNTVFRTLVNAAYQRFTLNDRGTFDGAIYNHSIAQGARYFRRIPQRTHYGRALDVPNMTDPFQS